MSLLVRVELERLRTDARAYGRLAVNHDLQALAEFYGYVRPLESRNKREGWYMARVKTLSAKGPNRLHLRSRNKEFALRYRKQTGAQVLMVTPKHERAMSAIGVRMEERK